MARRTLSQYRALTDGVSHFNGRRVAVPSRPLQRIALRSTAAYLSRSLSQYRTSSRGVAQ
eukprot:3618044-Rhodomonas_salina.1